MAIEDFYGTTSKAIDTAVDEESKIKVRSLFFNPYKSPLTVLVRTTSIVTDPILIGAISGYFALDAGYEVLKSIFNLVTLNTHDAKEQIQYAGRAALASAVLLVVAILSPLINLVDLFAGALTSFIRPEEDKEFEQSVSMGM